MIEDNDNQMDQDQPAPNIYNSVDFRSAMDKLIQELESGDLKIDNDNDELNDSPKKLLDCPHEIVFNVTANVLSQNEKGEHTSTKEICTKNYHIPVPIGKDYDSFMQTFFQHVERSLESSYQKTDTEIKDDTNG
jgi:hypothetical protein